jgi:Protein kinase domain
MPDDKKAGQIEKTPPALTGFQPDTLPTSDNREFLHNILLISDRYEVLGEAGRGGMGVVYRARDRETDEIVALKTLRPELAADLRLLERLKRELRLARRITHKNVCRVYDLHRTSTLCFVTMEFVDGESLRSVLRHRGALQLEEGITIARQICAALQEAHNQDIVHRDLKPENVMIDHSGTVKVMDFGIARTMDTAATLTAGVLGTPAYMAPEQTAGLPVDRRTDIYSLGLVLYEVFTGVTAFTADTPIALAWKQVHERPVHPRDLEPALPAALERVILKCLEKDASRRYQTAEQLELALRQVLETPPAAARTTAGTKRLWFVTASAEELPRLHRGFARTLFLLIQLLYLSFYLIALAKFGTIQVLLTHFLPTAGPPLAEILRVTALLGMALRLYLLSGVGFDYKGVGNDFRRLWFLLALLDSFWALSPLLLFAAGKIGHLAFACVIALAFLPLSQRTLIRMAYAWLQE